MTRPPFNPLLWPLAVALSQEPWTAQAIKSRLAQHLPPLFNTSLPAAARHLLSHLPGPTTPDPKAILTALRRSALADRLRQFRRRTGQIPAPIWTPTPFRPTEALAALPIPRLTTTTDLAEWLAVSPDQLTLLADPIGLSARNLNPYAQNYLHHRIPKSDGTQRLIEEPRPLLKRTQRRILSGILNLVPPHPAAHGFTLGRSAAMAAAKHCGEAMVVTFDLQDFFPSIRFARIYAIFRALGFPRATALPLTQICTAWPNAAYTTRHLPQGAPTSPALANLAALRLDARLSGLARSMDATYTRYADDLTFSGDAPITALLTIVPQIIRAEGFTPNPHKTRAQPAQRNQTVTGITVNHHLNLNRRAYDRLKAQIHNLAKAPPDPASLAHLDGRIQWAEQLNPARAHRLRTAFTARTVAPAPAFP